MINSYSIIGEVVLQMKVKRVECILLTKTKSATKNNMN